MTRKETIKMIRLAEREILEWQNALNFLKAKLEKHKSISAKKAVKKPNKVRKVT